MKKFLALIFVTLFLFTSCKEEVKPKEVETPIDVEENTEVKQPEKTETPTEVEESKKIVIELPTEPYTEPELVSPEEFDWGEYYPIVDYSVGQLYIDDIPVIEEDEYHYAILTKDIKNLEEGTSLYNKLGLPDIQQLLQSTPESFESPYELDLYISQLERQFFQRAPESSEVIAWDKDVFVDGEGNPSKDSADIFLEAIIEDRYLIFEVISFENYYQSVFSYDTVTEKVSRLINFAYDFSISPDGKYLAYCSPAGESVDGADISHHNGSNVLNMQEGFYIKNLENNETVFFSCDNVCHRYQFCSRHFASKWISKEDYEKLTETPTEVEEIILPEPDENTKVIEISFPEDFSEEPYTEPELVSPEEFEWGEYVPFVMYSTDKYTNSWNYVYSFALLNKSNPNFQKGKELYNLLNEKYLIENEVSGTFLHCDINENESYKDALTKSNIIYISEDAQKVARFYITKSEKQEILENDLLYSLWDFYLDYFDNGELVFTETTKENSLLQSEISSGKYLSYSNKYTHPETKTNYRIPDNSNGYIYYRDSDTVVYTDYSVPSFYSSGEVPDSVNWYIYSIKENCVTYQVNLPSYRYVKDDKTYSSWGKILQVISEKFLLIDFYNGVSENDYGYNNFQISTYLFDIENETLIPLENYCENALISSDLDYLAYTDITDPEVEFSVNNLINQKSGLYVKNLKDGKTVFFEHDGSSYPLNWINEKLFLNKISQ